MSDPGEQDRNPAAPAFPLGTVAILGLGLIGGSIGMALRAAGAARVVGWNRSPGVLPEALARGAADSVTAEVAEAVADADLVVIGVTVEATIPLLARAVPHLKPDAVVTDVGSAKARIAAEGQQALPGRFVGSHPMAGSERTGIAAASAGLLRGAPWILTPVHGTEARAVAAVEALARATGAVPRRCEPGLHDRLVAAVSHLPHILAFGLAETAGRRVDPSWTGLAAGSFRDGARVAGSDPRMWAGILTDNRAEALDALDAFLAWAGEVRGALQTGDAGRLESLLIQARKARERFPT